MHHNTIADRARKTRIREREQRRQAAQLRKLDNISDAQLDTLKKIKAAEAKEKPVKATSVSDWNELRAMGVVREEEGALVLTNIGAQVVASEEPKR
ncbi:MAG TPA: hypothetical protein VKQ72_00300 [Aggregatilineales bacterium]|nr:hypothetical protein [Aggregatilineales bacterium]